MFESIETTAKLLGYDVYIGNRTYTTGTISQSITIRKSGLKRKIRDIPSYTINYLTDSDNKIKIELWHADTRLGTRYKNVNEAFVEALELMEQLLAKINKEGVS